MRRASGAYPRSRGATAAVIDDGEAAQGLSPLARGNLRRRHARQPHRRPIPARAGQPIPCPASPRCGWAYPRSRGATGVAQAVVDFAEGLSPLARGNLRRRHARQPHRRPIPARAGQPSISPSRPAFARAYPRSRGATFLWPAATRALWGLSPLARGNHRRPEPPPVGHGPIPARAGQPRSIRSPRPEYGAYPRSRGATSVRARPESFALGLSPLARGNRLVARQGHPGAGPIPARAGQPYDAACHRTDHGAYPRSRGATFSRMPRRSAACGLSPLARGNLSWSTRYHTRENHQTGF